MMRTALMRAPVADRCRRSFTLVELLLSIAMIALLAAALLIAMAGAMENAKETRTRAQIARLHALMLEKWEAYRTRSIAISIPAGTTTDGNAIAWVKMVAMRELMRMELPERMTDLNNFPTPITIPGLASSVKLPVPAAWRGYRRLAGYTATGTSPPSSWTYSYSSAECLYLIVSASKDGERSALEFFTESETGDVDGDGMREILDGWGRPIYFFRWAPGFVYQWGPNGKWGKAATDDNSDGRQDEIFERGYDDDLLVSDLHSVNAQEAPDSFDPRRVDYRWRDSVGTTNDPFALVPLIYSSGRDGVSDLFNSDASFSYASLPSSATANTYTSVTSQVFNNDPYITFPDPTAGNTLPVFQIGTPYDEDGDGVLGSDDNITNHLLTTR